MIRRLWFPASGDVPVRLHSLWIGLATDCWTSCPDAIGPKALRQAISNCWPGVVGDSVTIANRISDVSDAEAASLREEYEREMTQASEQYAAIVKEYEKAAEQDGDVPQQLQDELQAASSRFSELCASRRKFIDERRTRFVWVYLRSPPATSLVRK